jgi:hypothetical protein
MTFRKMTSKLEGIRTRVQWGRLLGPETWLRQAATHLGLEFKLLGPGRSREFSDVPCPAVRGPAIRGLFC